MNNLQDLQNCGKPLKNAHFNPVKHLHALSKRSLSDSHLQSFQNCDNNQKYESLNSILHLPKENLKTIDQDLIQRGKTTQLQGKVKNLDQQIPVPNSYQQFIMNKNKILYDRASKRNEIIKINNSIHKKRASKSLNPIHEFENQIDGNRYSLRNCVKTYIRDNDSPSNQGNSIRQIKQIVSTVSEKLIISNNSFIKLPLNNIRELLLKETNKEYSISSSKNQTNPTEENIQLKLVQFYNS